MATTSRRKKQPASHRKRRFHWGRLLLLILLAAAIPASIWMALQLKNPIQLKSDTYQVQINSDFDPYGNLKSVFFDSTSNVQFQGDVDTTTIGTYDGSYTYKGQTYPFTIEVGDFKGPEMTLADYTTDTVETVTAESFIAKDENGNLQIGDDSAYSLKLEAEENNKQAGTYTVTVVAKDSYGNTTEKTARLTRKEDTKAPVLSDFEDQVTIKEGMAYYEKNYPMSDDFDPNPSIYVDASQVDPNTPGEYTATYTLRDRSGNEAVYTQAVTVTEDPEKGEKIVYMTFDDGPSANTRKVLDILKENEVTATFFVTGTHPNYNDVMKEITDSGNAIALHTYSHNYEDVYASTDAYFEDLAKISDLVKEETGVESKVIRFPGGSSNLVSSGVPGLMTRLASMVHDQGYEYFDWNVDSQDASSNDVSAQEIQENAEAGIGMERVVILFHDTDAKDTTVEALPAIIKAYKDAGYKFESLTPDSVLMHHNILN